MALSTKTALLLLLISVSASGADAPAPAQLPKPSFQGDFFAEMARAFCAVQSVDPRAHTMTVKLERDGKIVTVPIKDDTELRFRDSWGELTDYFPGQRVMLFVYVDENRTWTYPRAVQDEIQVSAAHNWFAAVTAIDVEKRTYSTHREEKDKAGKATKSEDKHYTFDPAVKVWKGAKPADIDALKIGDEVIPQQIEKDGKLVVVEVIDRAGDKAIRAAQDERNRAAQERLGLSAYVTDVEVITGALTVTVAWSGAERAKAFKPNDTITISADGQPTPFAAAVITTQPVDTRRRLTLANNARVAARLNVGQPLRVFLPNTGPEAPTGKLAVPASAFK
jgi:hypothetical protein